MVLRVIGAVGNSAFLTGSFCMITNIFPENIATMFGVSEAVFGVGMICGPTAGGLLYEVGGFLLPFVTLGGLNLLAGLFITAVLPNVKQNISDDEKEKKPGVMTALNVPLVNLALYKYA